MSENPIIRNIEEVQTGVIKVSVESQRGTGTDDRDKAKARAYYESIEDAEEHSGRLARLVATELEDQRRIGEDGILEEDVVESEEELGEFEIEK